MRFLHFIIIYFFSINYCFSEQLFTPYIKDSSMDQRSIALVDTITGKNRLVEINTDGKIIWSWNFPSEINKSPRNICKGADIKYIAKDDSFIIIMPHFGAISVKRDGSFNILIKDDEIDHDLHVFENESILFARGFVNKGEDNFAIHDKQNKKVWGWDISDHVKDRKPYWGSSCKRREKNWSKKGDKDWGHANSLEVLSNGNYLFSFRNLSAFFEVNPSGKIIREYKGNVGVHVPKVYKDGFVLADRNCKGSKKSNFKEMNSIKILDSNGKVKKELLKGEHMCTRGIQVLSNDRLFITTLSSLIEIDNNGKIYYKSVLKNVDENLEKDGLKTRKEMKGFCKWRTVYKAVKTK